MKYTEIDMVRTNVIHKDRYRQKQRHTKRYTLTETKTYTNIDMVRSNDIHRETHRQKQRHTQT